MPLTAAVALLASAAGAAEWYVAPNGMPAGHGTQASPWDLESALEGTQKIAPGDTLWLHGGTYKKPFELLGQGYVVRLAGREGAPVRVCAFGGERVTVDGGLSIQPPAAHRATISASSTIPFTASGCSSATTRHTTRTARCGTT